jgi:hypothetical protein
MSISVVMEQTLKRPRKYQANLLIAIFRGGLPKSSTLHWEQMYYATGVGIVPSNDSPIAAPVIGKAKGILSPGQTEGLLQAQATWGKKWR